MRKSRLIRGSRLVWLALVAAAVLVVAGGWQYFLRDDARPATVREAVSSFRHGAAPTEEVEPGLAAGVYVYATTGFETVDALGGARHEYPRRTTITVARGGCGVKLRWVALEARSTTWERCIVPRGYVLRRTYEVHRFFGTTDRTTYLCGTTLERPQGDRPGATWPFRCTAKGILQKGTGRVVARETVSIAGTRVVTVHLHWETTLTGKTTGTSEQDSWLARASGLPVRLRMTSETATGSIVGDVHYHESAELKLTSLRPRT